VSVRASSRTYIHSFVQVFDALLAPLTSHSAHDRATSGSRARGEAAVAIVNVGLWYGPLARHAAFSHPASHAASHPTSRAASGGDEGGGGTGDGGAGDGAGGVAGGVAGGADVGLPAALALMHTSIASLARAACRVRSIVSSPRPLGDGTEVTGRCRPPRCGAE